MPTPFANLFDSYEQPYAGRAPHRPPEWPWPPWLTRSWEQPDEFFAALFAQAELLLGGPAKSQLATGIDWYTDAVLRHLSGVARAPAIRWYEPVVGWQDLALAQLDAQASALAAALAARGAEPGARIALVLPSGASLLVGLLAVLRLGGCAVPVLPLGSAYVQAALLAGKPQQVVSCSPYTALRGLLEYKPLLLSTALSGPARRPPPVATYSPEAPALLVQSPLRPPGTLSAVTAGEAYVAALRDGLLVFGLRRGDMLLVAPTPQYLPTTLLAALLCGAGYVEMSANAALHGAQALLREPVRAALLTPALRDMLIASGGGPARWGRWFRDPQEVADPAAWELAEPRLRLSELPHANLVYDCAAGGVVLTSALRRGPVHSYVAPAPGCRYLMGAPHGHGPAVTAAGRLVLLRRDDKPPESPGEALLLRTDNGFLYAGSALPRRAGWAYPVAAVEQVLSDSLADLALVGASVVELSRGGTHGQALFVLVLFTGGAPSERVDSAACVTLLERELGPAARPDRVAVFPLYPRRLGSAPDCPVDTRWVSAQYVTGELHRKSMVPLFRALTELRSSLLAAALPKERPAKQERWS